MTYENFTLVRYPKTDLRFARQRCEQVLKKDQFLPTLSSNCIISIVVPVYDERADRLIQQIKSFEKQTINTELFEIVYIVNNPVRSKTPSAVLQNNDRALSILRKIKSPLAIHVIDRSSKGHELSKGNVGEARNYAIHLTTARYIEQNRDGILLQTDADSWPKSTSLLKKVVKDMSGTNYVGASGGVQFVLSIDSKNKARQMFYKKNIKMLNRFFQWYWYLRAYQNKSLTPLMTPTRFSGANMISLAVASICAHGVPELFGGVDLYFGRNLEEYAKKRGFSILSRRDHWIMKTALRESSRTTSGFGKKFQEFKNAKAKPLVVSYQALPIDKFIMHRIDTVTKPTDPIEKKFRKSVMKVPRKVREGSIQKILTQDEYRELKANFFSYYTEKYPLVELTKSRFDLLKKMVDQDSYKKTFAENAIKYFATFYLK